MFLEFCNMPVLRHFVRQVRKDSPRIEISYMFELLICCISHHCRHLCCNFCYLGIVFGSSKFYKINVKHRKNSIVICKNMKIISNSLQENSRNKK